MELAAHVSIKEASSKGRDSEGVGRAVGDRLLGGYDRRVIVWTQNKHHSHSIISVQSWTFLRPNQSCYVNPLATVMATR